MKISEKTLFNISCKGIVRIFFRGNFNFKIMNEYHPKLIDFYFDWNRFRIFHWWGAWATGGGLL